MRGTAVKLKSDAFQSHLWIVVSDVHPTRGVVLAFSLTDKANYPGCCCTLNPGEHEYIQKASAVRYFSPKLWKPEQIAAKIKDGTFVQYKNASAALVEKIVAGAHNSEDLDPYYLEFLPPARAKVP